MASALTDRAPPWAGDGTNGVGSHRSGTALGGGWDNGVGPHRSGIARGGVGMMGDERMGRIRSGLACTALTGHLLLEILQSAAQSLLPANERLPTQQLTRSGDVRLAHPWVILGQRPIDDLAGAPR